MGADIDCRALLCDGGWRCHSRAYRLGASARGNRRPRRAPEPVTRGERPQRPADSPTNYTRDTGSA